MEESTNQDPAPKKRGFAAMDPARQREIASKGGAAISQNREHMSVIGRKGGESVSQDREHMSEIGRKGGESSGGGNGGNQQ
jgi:general stress protein YciG